MTFSPQPIRNWVYGAGANEVIVEMPLGEPWKRPPRRIEDVPPEWTRRPARPERNSS
jgi:hypothetical protein